jgi:hypothetical protein
MRDDDDFPRPVSDPAAEGLPDTADDDSTAYDDVESGRIADGPDPAALPSDTPAAVDRFGTTAQEQLVGSPLNARLAQEEPDVLASEPDPDAPGEDVADEDSDERAQFDADVVSPGPESDPNSPVSLYDRPLDGTPGEPVGRLVAPDQGYLSDTEADAIAYDAGAAGGGPSAEELAVHETPPPA